MPSKFSSLTFPPAAIIFEASAFLLPSPPSQALPGPAWLNSAHLSALRFRSCLLWKASPKYPSPTHRQTWRTQLFPSRVTCFDIYFNTEHSLLQLPFDLPSPPPAPITISSVKLKTRFVFLFIIIFLVECHAYFRHAINVC